MYRPTINTHILAACQEFCPAITFLKDRVKFTRFRSGAIEGDPVLQLTYSYMLNRFDSSIRDESALPDVREQASHVIEAVGSIINGVTF